LGKYRDERRGKHPLTLLKSLRTNSLQIILTCIPVLAPLFKFFSQKFGSYGYGSKHVKESHNMQVFSSTANTSNAASKAKNYAEISTSNESQETILGALPAYGKATTEEKLKNGEIMRTIQVDVQTSQSNPDRGAEERIRAFA
jgi:hypothetical protein